MEIQIWSDVRCPFCYIGKHKFENALEKFPHKDKIKIVWRSFELDPGLETMPQINALDHLATIKGMPRTQVDQMSQHIVAMGREEGLDFHFDSNVVANSFNAHRLIQLAKTKNLGDTMEEALFKAHFTDGKNIDDLKTLTDIGVGAGLDAAEVETTLNDANAFADAVTQDEEMAGKLGIRSVPTFVFNNKYGIAGAQPEEAFLETLQKSWEEYEKDHPTITFTQGQSCSVDGECE